MRFGKGVVEQILAHAAATPAIEVCGLLFGAADRVEAALACANVADDPGSTFELDPAALFAALRSERSGGPRVLGCYHSHPGGIAAPSPRDAADAAPNGWLWLIVGGDGVRLFRAMAAGPIHGRFTPIIMPALCRHPPSA